MELSKKFPTFYSKDAVEINKARIDHFNSLKLSIRKKTILETGCGAKGDFTKNLLDRGAKVTVMDARKYIVNGIKEKYKVDGFTANLNYENSVKGIYDFIFCYGTLYHLSSPIQALKHLSKSCKEGIIISTCITHNESKFVFENENDPTQSVDGLGFRPTRKWVMNELSNYFDYVYVSRTQPNHPEFPTEWGGKYKTECIRAVFIGSHRPLRPKIWSPTLLQKQKSYN